MEKKLISIMDLEESMILGEDLINKNGMIMLGSGTKLNKDLLKKVRTLHYSDKIYILSETKFENKNLDIFIDNYDDYKEEQIKNEKKIKKRKKYANKIAKLANELNEKIYIELIKDEEFHKNFKHIVFDIKKLANDPYNIFSVILSDNSIENYLYEHTIRSTIISTFLAQWMKLKDEEINIIIEASLLKDIGHLKTPKEILNKPGKLLNSEFKEIKKHPLFSYAKVKNLGNISKTHCEIILQHHEREDGSGYPLGLKNEEINILSKIVTIGDMFTAMTSKRIYSEKNSPFKVIEEFQKSSFDKLHMGVVMTFTNKFTEYYINAKVKLSNNLIGQIVRIDMSEISKPLIKLSNGDFLDLKVNRDIEIFDIIDKVNPNL